MRLSPSRVTLFSRIHPLTVVKSGLSSSSGSSTHTLSVPPSTDRLFVGCQSYDCWQHPQVLKTATTNLSRLCPSFKSSTLVRRYLTPRTRASTRVRPTVMSSSRTLTSSPHLVSFTSSSRPMITWRSGKTTPFMAYRSRKARMTVRRPLSFRCTRSATAYDLVDESDATAAAAANIVVCAQSHQAIVLTYGDDGLVSSCDSVVEL